MKIFSSGVGSPPPARGEEAAYGLTVDGVGITPACAGRSQRLSSFNRPPWDHPRLRGEKFFVSGEGDQIVGSPPPARGEDISMMQYRLPLRITPACAGRRDALRVLCLM